MSNIRISNVLVMFAALAVSACGGGGGESRDNSPPPNESPGAPQTNSAPLITGSLANTAMVGQSYSFLPNASDPDGDALTFTVFNLPSWMTFNSQTGALTGTPQTGDEGTYSNIVVAVSDGTDTVELPGATVVVGTNVAPTFTNTPFLQAIVGVNYSFVPSVSDPDSSNLVFSVENLPGWGRFDETDGSIFGVPAMSDLGTNSAISISVTDGQSTTTLGPFDIVVSTAGGNLPPEISGSPALAVTAGSAYSFTPSAADPEGAALTFGVQNVPAWSNFDPQTGALTGTPGAAQIGSYANIIISVTDGVTTASLDAFDIAVLPATSTNSPPSISGVPANNVSVGTTYSFAPQASDADGDSLVFSIQNRPAWASFNAASGLLVGTPAASDVGTYSSIRISVSDGTVSTTLPVFTISVVGDNTAPVISGSPAATVRAGVNYAFLPTSSDADGDSLSFTIANLPGWATFGTTTGQLTGVPSDSDVGTYSNITITVSDGIDTATLAPFTIEVTSGNSAPIISGSPAVSVKAGTNYLFVPTASDVDGDNLRFTIENLPKWASFFSSLTGRLSGVPSESDVGTYSNIVITVTDGIESTSLAPFSITVTSSTVPIISGSPTLTVEADTNYSFIPTASDADGDTLGFTIANLPSWATFNNATGQLSGVPSQADAGVYANIVISVTDDIETVSLAPFTITVTSSSAPQISGSPTLSVEAGTNYVFAPTASDVDGDTLSFSVANLPGWATFSSTTGELSGLPSVTDAGTYANIVISVSDGNETVSLPAFTITVTSASAPQISGVPAVSVEAGTNYLFVPTASDADGDTLSFTIANLPSWAAFSSTTGQLSGVPADADAGTYADIVITVSDGTETTSLGAFTITVTAANTAPQISGSPSTLSVEAGSSYSFIPTASDADGDTLTFNIVNLPSWATFSSTTGELSGVPAESDAGTYGNILISVSDGTESASLAAISITVTSGNSQPQISGAPASLSVEAGASYSFTPTATDLDGDTLSFTVANLPGWATFSSTTGELSGVPEESDTGPYGNIVITVSDGTDTASLSAFTIIVISSNSAPQISGSAASSVEAGNSYSFVPTASDDDGDTLSFAVTNLPGWLAFSSTTGELSGVPAQSDTGTYANIVISVSDGNETASLAGITITVTAANSAPQISGSPSTTITASTAYSFTPTASDADGDDLTFSIANRPVWAAFNSTTGQLSGTPDSSEVGTYPSIVISVSDGEESTSLAAFSIEVTDVVLGGITLNWTPPTEYEDGSPLNDLAGYRINYGTMPGDYTSVEEVNVTGISTYMIENLAPGTYYIALTVVNSAGVTSAFSEEVTVVVTGN